MGATRTLGPIGRLGRFAATHPRRVLIVWALLLLTTGVLSPRVETALSGAGWEDNGSESVRARQQLERNFDGAGAYALTVAVRSRDGHGSQPRLRAAAGAIEGLLRADP